MAYVNLPLLVNLHQPHLERMPKPFVIDPEFETFLRDLQRLVQVGALQLLRSWCLPMNIAAIVQEAIET